MILKSINKYAKAYNKLDDIHLPDLIGFLGMFSYIIGERLVRLAKALGGARNHNFSVSSDSVRPSLSSVNASSASRSR